MTYRCILPPNGACIVRMSPPNHLYFICLTRLWNSWSNKDALIPEIAPVRMGNGSARSFFYSSAPGCSINDSFWVSGCGRLPFTSHKACKHLIGWPRGSAKAEVHQGDQAKGLNYMDQVLLLAVGVSAGEHDIVKVFPEKVIKLKVALSCFLCLSGLI